MKQTRSIADLAKEIVRQQQNKRDFLVNTNKVEAFVNDNHLELGFPIETDLVTAPLTGTGHDQLAGYCNIPKKYYDLVKGKSSELLANNVQYWLKHQSDRRMIRILDGNVRAVLSDRYRRLDNFDLVQAVLPMLAEANLVIDGSEITEKRLYLKARNPKVTAEISTIGKDGAKVGDILEAGVIIQNSEIGEGSLSVKPFAYKLSCLNGAIADMFAMKKYHTGRINEIEQIEFENDTLQADDTAFFLKVRDLVNHSLSENTFLKIVDSMQLSTTKLIAEPTKAIELATKKFGFNQTEQEDVLKHLIEGGSLTSWGLGNAITRMAQDVPSYDRSVELESIGFDAMLRSWNSN
jgi:hypothetical protein